MQTGLGRGKFLNSKVAGAEAAEDQVIEHEQAIAQLEDQVARLTIENAGLKELSAATSQALNDAYSLLQKQAVELAMLQRRMAKRLIQECRGDRANGQ